MKLIWIFFITLFLSIIITFIVQKIAIRFDITDKPNSPRKIHKKKIPLLGGIGIFISFFLVLFFLRGDLISGNLNYGHWVGFFMGALFLVIGGALDDKFNLKPGQQLFFPILAVISVLFAGISIEKLSNPLGGDYLYLADYGLINLQFGDLSLHLSYISSLLIFFWLMGMMYTTKLLDGIDGLVGGVSTIGALIIFLFTMTEKYHQPDIALASLVLTAACLGFLFFNWHPASIFMGEGGSLFCGYALGVLAIISGGKIAVALLVMGIPIMDVAWTIVRRTRKGKNPFKFSDREHLHFLLLDTGIGQRKTVGIYYIISLLFGLSALFLQSKGKLLAIGILAILMFAIVYFFKKIKSKKLSSL